MNVWHLSHAVDVVSTGYEYAHFCLDDDCDETAVNLLKALADEENHARAAISLGDHYGSNSGSQELAVKYWKRAIEIRDGMILTWRRLQSSCSDHL